MTYVLSRCNACFKDEILVWKTFAQPTYPVFSGHNHPVIAKITMLWVPYTIFNFFFHLFPFPFLLLQLRVFKVGFSPSPHGVIADDGKNWINTPSELVFLKGCFPVFLSIFCHFCLKTSPLPSFIFWLLLYHSVLFVPVLPSVQVIFWPPHISLSLPQPLSFLPYMAVSPHVVTAYFWTFTRFWCSAPWTVT